MRLFLGLFLGLLSLLSFAEISKPMQGRLDNGMKYTILPLHKEKGRMEIRIKVDAGSVDQKDNQHGVAHMVEHMVFRATQAYPNGVMDYLHANNWVRTKNYNAVTSATTTTYMYLPPKGTNLEQTLKIASQMLLHANLTQKDLDKERKIIMEEWRSKQGVGTKMAEIRNDSMRSGSRYARSPVIGTVDAINEMPATELQDFYRIWYVPNNMHALIVGDVDEKSAVDLLNKYFGDEPYKNLPNRNYLDLELKDAIRINKLQDPRSGISEIAYMWRFDESKSNGESKQAARNRLIDRLVLAMLTQRLRNQRETLPDDVKNIVVRKSELGNHTAILGIFASVENQAHQQALKQILQEVERLKRYPFTKAELDKQKGPVQEQINFAKKSDNDRDFEGWMQAMMNTVMVDKPYMSQSVIANFNDPLLKSIKLKDVRSRLNEWLSAKDRIVQYQAPHNTEIEPLTEEMVNDYLKQTKKSKLSAPQKEKSISPMSLLPADTHGKILTEKLYAEQNVRHWMLSNGDKVIWLKSPLAKNKTYFTAQSNAGFRAKELNSWQSQVATQLIEQNAPMDWQIEQLNQWKKNHKVSLNINQTDRYLTINGQSENTHLGDLLRLYFANQAETQIKDGLDDAKDDLVRKINMLQKDSIELKKVKAVAEFRYGKYENDRVPENKEELNKLTAQDLNWQWKKMVSAPVTYYIVSNLSVNKMQDLVIRNLSAIPRAQSLTIEPLLPLTGRGEERFEFNREPKDDVNMWLFTPQQWQGKNAVMVSLLQNIVNNKLKIALRDNKSGIYSLRFESRLDPETKRIESELKFSSNPDNTQILLDEAKRVLSSITQNISEQDVKLAKIVFEEQEKNRLESVDTWMNRLILSETQHKNPQYLTDMLHLSDNITLENLKAMAKKLPSDNIKVFISTEVQNDRK